MHWHNCSGPHDWHPGNSRCGGNSWPECSKVSACYKVPHDFPTGPTPATHTASAAGSTKNISKGISSTNSCSSRLQHEQVAQGASPHSHRDSTWRVVPQQGCPVVHPLAVLNSTCQGPGLVCLAQCLQSLSLLLPQCRRLGCVVVTVLQHVVQVQVAQLS